MKPNTFLRTALFLLTFGHLTAVHAQPSRADEMAKPIVHTNNPMGYRMATPNGPGPFPVVVFANNCMGYDMPDIANGYHRHTSRLVQLGYAVVWDEYYKTRQIKTCAGVSYPDWASNILATTHWIQAQSWAKTDSLFLVGFSAGSQAASFLLANARTQKTAFKKIVMMYPACHFPYFTEWQSPTPVRYYVGTKEFGNTMHSKCEFAMRPVDKSNFSTVILEGAYHAFDIYEEGSRAIDGDSNGKPSSLAAIQWWSDFKSFIESP